MLQGLSVLQILLAALAVSLLIAWHELGHYVVARLTGMRVIRYSVGFGKKLVGFTKGGIEYQIGMLPFGGFVQIAGMSELEEGASEDPRSFVNRPRWARFLVLAAGPAFNYILAAAAFTVALFVWVSPFDHTVVELVDVVADGPAAQAGLVPGELIAAIDGKPFEDMGEFRSQIGAGAGAPVALSVFAPRDGGWSERTVTLTPQKRETGFVVGISPFVRYPQAGVVSTVAAAVITCYAESVQTLAGLKAVVTRQPGADLGGPIAIVREMKDQMARGAPFFLRMFGLISVSLGLFNLLPIPALDGIKMLFLAIEGLMRRDINPSFQVWVNGIGVITLLGLMLVLTARDTLHLFG